MELGALLDGATVVIDGGTGTLGTALVRVLLDRCRLRKLVLLSRSEARQAAMKRQYPENGGPLRYLIGDVRDAARLLDAYEGADVVIHAAALKRVEVCEREPKEALSTNVLGTLNACEAARQRGVHRFMLISSDKATAACTTYGATKYLAERLTIGMNNYRGARDIRYSAVRYGNVLGSTGSVLDTFRTCDGRVPITDPAMTRFWLTPAQAAEFVLSSLALMRGGEVFVPKLPSARLLDMAEAFAPGAAIDVIGTRGVEKIAECLVSADEAPWTIDLGDRFAILPAAPTWPGATWPDRQRMPAGWAYTSDTNVQWLTPKQLRSMADG
jgi:UDP-N-acetylglucosamine 4,6-dehydratase